MPETARREPARPDGAGSRADGLVVSPRLASLGLGLLGIALGGIVIAVLPAQTGTSGHAQLLDPAGPAFFPFLAACVAVAAGVWSLFDGATASSEPVVWRRSLQVAGWLGVVLLGLQTVGVVTAIGVMTAGLAVTFGQRRLWVLAVLAVGTPVAIHLLFEVALKILFPRGWLF